MRRIAIILCVAVITCSTGCAQLPLLSGIFNSSSDDNPMGSDLLDDFSDAKSGWEQFQIDEGSAGYSNKTYQISVNTSNTDIFSTYPRPFVNSEITVLVVKKEGADNNNFGLICRFKDAENFYAGQISSDGLAGIFKVEDGKYQLLGHQNMVPVQSIVGGSGKNEIRFDCIEGTLELSVNGELADSQKDGTFKSGEIGLIAGTIDDNHGVYQFDDFAAIAK